MACLVGGKAAIIGVRVGFPNHGGPRDPGRSIPSQGVRSGSHKKARQAMADVGLPCAPEFFPFDGRDPSRSVTLTQLTGWPGTLRSFFLAER